MKTNTTKTSKLAINKMTVTSLQLAHQQALKGGMMMDTKNSVLNKCTRYDQCP